MQLRPLNAGPFQTLEMVFSWQGHELFTQNIDGLYEEALSFRLSFIIGYMEIYLA